MKKPITKIKISLRLNDDVLTHLEKFENKSKYIESLIYENVKDLLKKEIIL